MDLLKVWDRQIAARPEVVIRHLYRWGGLAIAQHLRKVEWHDPLAPLGSFTYVVLRRSRLTSAIILAGYRSMLVDGVIQVGGVEGNVFCYDFMRRPGLPNRGGPMMLCLRKSTTLQLGLLLDMAIEQTALVGAPSAQRLLLPRFWAGFHPNLVPEAEDTPEMQEDIMALLGKWDTLPGCSAEWGGLVTQVDSNGQDIAIEFDSGNIATFPPSAVLRPNVQAGKTIEPGTILADPVAPGLYRSYSELEGRNGSACCRWLRNEVAKASDRYWGGLLIRRAEYVPSSLGMAKAVLEDASALLSDSWTEAETQNGSAERNGTSVCLPQVVPPQSLTGKSDWLRHDFLSLLPRWDARIWRRRKNQPIRPAHRSGPVLHSSASSRT